jgi:hypothetical protein
VNVRRASAAIATLLLFSLRASAQTAPRVEFRPFAVVAVERFTASTTFDANLDSSFQPLWGGGVEMTTRKNVFVDVTVTRLNRTGETAFVNDRVHGRLSIPEETTAPREAVATHGNSLRRCRDRRVSLRRDV